MANEKNLKTELAYCYGSNNWGTDLGIIRMSSMYHTDFSPGHYYILWDTKMHFIINAIPYKKLEKTQ